MDVEYTLNTLIELERNGETFLAPEDIEKMDLPTLTKHAAALKVCIGKMEDELKPVKERFKQISDLIIKTFDLMEIEKLSAHGYLFYKEVRSSVTTPKSPEDKELLFNYLKDKGIFLEMVSINSNTLNSLYANLAEDAAKEGILDFRLPGVPEPTTYTNLKLRKA